MVNIYIIYIRVRGQYNRYIISEERTSKHDMAIYQIVVAGKLM